MTYPQATRFVQPNVVTTHFHLRDGDLVGDFGAGTGYFLKALSKGVGSDGKVYACEIQKNLIEKLTAEITELKLQNTKPLWVDLEKEGGLKLTDSSLDVGVLINALFQLEDKETALREIARIIRKGGKFFVIDWTESFGGLGPSADSVVSEKNATELIKAAGFNLERTFPAGEHHYGLAFRRT